MLVHFPGINPFLQGREFVEDEHQVGRPSTSHTEVLVNITSVLVREDHHKSIRCLAKMLNVRLSLQKDLMIE